MTMFEKPACPECGSHEVIPIIYGLPSPDTVARAALGEVALGGCVVFDSAPDMYCSSCKTSYIDHRANRLFGEHEAEDKEPL